MSSDCWWSNCEAMHFYNWMCSSLRTHGCKVCHLAFLPTWFYELFECLVREQIKWTTFSCFIFYSFFVIVLQKWDFISGLCSIFLLYQTNESREKKNVFFCEYGFHFIWVPFELFMNNKGHLNEKGTDEIWNNTGRWFWNSKWAIPNFMNNFQ